MDNVPSWLQLNAQARRRPTGKHQTTVRQFVIAPGSNTSPLPAASPARVPSAVKQTPVPPSSSSRPSLPSPLPHTSPADATPAPQPIPVGPSSVPVVKVPKRSASPHADADAEARPVQKLKVAQYGPGTRTINTMDVALTTVLATAIEYKSKLDIRLPELDQFVREAEIELTTQSQLIDEQRLVASALRKSSGRKRSLRQQLIRTQKEVSEAETRREAAQRQLDTLRADRRRRQDEEQLRMGIEVMKERIASAPGADLPKTETMEAAVLAANEGILALSQLRYVNNLLMSAAKIVEQL